MVGVKSGVVGSVFAFVFFLSSGLLADEVAIPQNIHFRNFAGSFVTTSEPAFYPAIKAAIRERAFELAGENWANTSRPETEITIVTDELIFNVYRHAHRDNLSKRIWLRMWADDEQVFLQVQDEGGDFFDPYSDSDPRNKFRFRHDSEINEKTVFEMMDRRSAAGHDPARPAGDGGRGVMLMESFCRSLKYEPHLVAGKVIGTSVTVGFALKSDLPREVSEAVASCPARISQGAVFGWFKKLNPMKFFRKS